jgi:hypothetical protein
MTNFTELPSVPSDRLVPFTDQLRLAVAAYLARFKGSPRDHTGSDLRCFLAWCAERGLDPLAARRPYLELYIRWMQEIRHFKPSTVSRRPRAIPTAAHRSWGCAPHNPNVVGQHRRIAERLDGEVEAVRLVCAPLRGALLHGGLRWRATQFGSVAMRPGSISHFGGGQVVVTYAAPAETAVVAPLGRT